MTKKQCFFRSNKEKLKIISIHFPHLFSGKVLDVGCGDSHLKELIQADYVGIDKYGKPDVLKDISAGLPFKDGSFDTVAAFDILEHMDDIYFIFNELCRVSRNYVVITLPNMFEWRFRLSFLFGKSVSAKYGLPKDPSPDRHRWHFSFTQAEKFVKKRAEKNNFMISQEIICYYKYNKILPRVINKIGSLLGRKFQNLFASHYLVILERKRQKSL